MIFEHVCKRKLEGITSKRIDLPYQFRPLKSWRTVKNKEHPAVKRVACT
jgi:ATP-dependent DNA ligase